VPDGEDFEKRLGLITKAAVALSAKFARDGSRADPGRCSKPLCDTVKDAALEMLEFAIGKLGIVNDVAPRAKMVGVQAQIDPILFAVVGKKEMQSQEPGHMASVRLGMQGTRKVILLPTLSLKEYLEEEDVTTKLTPRLINKALRERSHEVIKDFMNSSGNREASVFYATAGEKDMLFIPAGWTSSE
jgi:hypothetical protein